jgi:hypothetical protein
MENLTVRRLPIAEQPLASSKFYKLIGDIFD